MLKANLTQSKGQLGRRVFLLEAPFPNKYKTLETDMHEKTQRAVQDIKTQHRKRGKRQKG